MIIPSEATILLSYINTLLRDNYESLEELCKAQDVSPELIKKKLETIDYVYDEEQNRFI